MIKKHLRIGGVDMREHGQTEHEFTHQSACGFVRKNVVIEWFKVDCLLCKKTEAYGDQEHGE